MPRPGSTQQSPAQRRLLTRRVITALVVVDVVIAAAAVLVFLALREDPDENAVNDGLRGSRPPAGQMWPKLAGIDGIEPSVPDRADVRGAATMLVATCLECRSGDIIGGFLGRLGADGLPADARVVVVGWEGDPQAWREQWGLDERIEQHHAETPDAVARTRRMLGVGPVAGAEESGIAFLHDTRGRWRSTFYVGQLDRADIEHDLDALGRD